MYKPKYAMFFDNHTQKACPDMGQNFDAEAFGTRLEKAGVDFIGFHAKCNQGLCYFNTEKGVRHPTLKEGFDLFGETVKACKKHNIAVAAYLNCGLSNEDGVLHPEWCKLSPEGHRTHFELFNMGYISPFLRPMCMNSPYRDHFFSLVKEVMAQYDVKGFLFDSMNSFPCVCPYCVEGMKKLSMDYTDPQDVVKFAHLTSVRMAQDLAALLRSSGKEYLCNFLGLTPRENGEIATYMECECLPTNPVWGYDTLPIAARYYRTVKKDAPHLNMTGRFYDWGDFGSLRTAAAVEYDLFFGLANGMRPNIADHFLPSGEINHAMFDRVQEILSHVKPYEKWHEDAVNAVDFAVLLPGDDSEKNPALAGVIRLLSELRMQFDIVDSSADFTHYPFLILPDHVRFNDTLAKKLSVYLKQGGKLFATGESGLKEDCDSFALEKEFAVRCLGKCKHDPAYFKMDPPYSSALPDLPLAARLEGYEVELLSGSQRAGHLVKSYFNKHWDGVYSYFYTPPRYETDEVFAAVSDSVIYCAFPVFEAYYKTASSDLRTAVANLLKVFLEKPLVAISRQLPSFARVFVTDSPCGRMVHLLNYVPELRGEMLIVEEGLNASDVEITLRLDGRIPRKVYLAPEGKQLPFHAEADSIRIQLDSFTGYALLVCEE